MGLNCTTGTGQCSVGKPGKLAKVEPTAADSAILETAMKDVVLKRWAKRCGSRCQPASATGTTPSARWSA